MPAKTRMTQVMIMNFELKKIQQHCSLIFTGEEEGLNPETLARIGELEQGLAGNPYNYANHEELVKLLKGGEDFER